MRSILNDSLEWLDCAEQAREVAGQLTDPSARKAVLELAESFDRLARTAATPAVLRRRELPTGQHRGIPTPEEQARITELQDLLIERFVEQREAVAEGQEERVKTVEAEIDSLLREKEEIEKWAAVGSA
jgi:hypothetical protein